MTSNMLRGIAALRVVASLALGAGCSAATEDPPEERAAAGSGGSAGAAGARAAGGSGGTAAPTPMAIPSTEFDAWKRWQHTPRASRLPVVMVEANGQMGTIQRVKATVRVKVISQHDGTHKDLATAKPDIDSLAGISLRGSSSAGFPQKGYTFGFLDDKGVDRELRVLDMPAGEDWALIACWTDKPCMRNALAYTMGRVMGGPHPRFRFVDVFFDGRYNGVYQLTEPPRADKWRVPVSRPAWDAKEGDVTGGYIVRREMGGKGTPTSMPILDFVSPVKGPDGFTQTVYTYHFPKEFRLSKAHQDYLTDYFTRFETMMLSPDWKDAAKGYAKWLDVTSWIDFGLVNEVSNNVDAYWKSMYLTKESDKKGGKLLVAPFWDFNIAFGNADYRDGHKPDNWAWQLNRFGGEQQGSFVPKRTEPAWNMPYVPFWWEKLWKDDPGFRDLMKCRFRDLRKPGGAFDQDAIDKQIESWRAELKPSAPRHFQRWQGLLTKVWPNTFVSDKANDPPRFFDEETDFLKRWVRDRIAFLDAMLPGTCSAR